MDSNSNKEIHINSEADRHPRGPPKPQSAPISDILTVIGEEVAETTTFGTGNSIPRPKDSQSDSIQDCTPADIGRRRRHGGKDRPSPQPELQHRTPVYQHWLWEFLSLIVSMSAFIVLIALLSNYDHTPLSPWVLGITLNGVIATLTFFSRSCMIMVVESCIGQLKWHWLQRPRPLLDLSRFDEASRGGMGAWGMLVRTRWTIAQLGALILILAAAIDPFAQQLTSYPSVEVKTPVEAVTAARAVEYTMLGGAGSISENLRNGLVDHNLASFIQAAILYREPKYVDTLNSLRLNCPSRSNCTWDTFTSLGVCTACAKLEEGQWETDCPRTPGKPSNCSYTIPEAASFSFNTSTHGGSHLIFESKEVTNAFSRAYLGVENPLVAIASIRSGYFDLANHSLYTYFPPKNMTICSLHFCTQTWTAHKTNSQASMTVVREWRNDSRALGAVKTLQDVVLSPTRQDLGIPIDRPFEQTTYYVPAKVAELVQHNLRSQLLGSWTNVQKGTQYEGVPNFTHAGPSNGVRPMECIASVDTLEIILDSVAKTMSIYFRTLKENNRYRASGYTVNHVTLIYVSWAWIALPAALYALTLILFVATVCKSRSKVPIWKNSILATLFHNAMHENQTAVPDTEKDMARLAKGMQVELKV
ncbi:hypothetical protein GGR57DRAFT_465938 [Xylariaceae sp. FL1272]|nr:hypothetical protein GGR57DRAFT_465938 [Xylariaceae sp. FL1272]